MTSVHTDRQVHTLTRVNTCTLSHFHSYSHALHTYIFMQTIAFTHKHTYIQDMRTHTKSCSQILWYIYMYDAYFVSKLRYIMTEEIRSCLLQFMIKFIRTIFINYASCCSFYLYFLFYCMFGSDLKSNIIKCLIYVCIVTSRGILGILSQGIFFFMKK